MMFDRPGLLLYTACANLGPITGFVLSRHYGGGWDANLFLGGGITVLTGLVLSFFLGHEYDEYKRLLDAPGSPHLANEPRVIPNLNQPMYEQITPLVKVDVWGIRIKRCCRTLINQRENDFRIDLREQTWKGQFGGRDNFVHFRDTIMVNAFAKQYPERKNSPYIVINWDEVKRGANGQLPH